MGNDTKLNELVFVGIEEPQSEAERSGQATMIFAKKETFKISNRVINIEALLKHIDRLTRSGGTVADLLEFLDAEEKARDRA